MYLGRFFCFWIFKVSAKKSSVISKVTVIMPTAAELTILSLFSAVPVNAASELEKKKRF